MNHIEMKNWKMIIGRLGYYAFVGAVCLIHYDWYLFLALMTAMVYPEIFKKDKKTSL